MGCSMDKDEASSIVLKILEDHKYTHDNEYSIYTLSNDLDVTNDVILEAFSTIGYLKSSELIENVNELYISRSNDAWKDGSILYPRKSELWEFAERCNKLPELYFIEDDKISSLNVNHQFIKNIKAVLLWRKLFLEIADHTADNNKVVLFVNRNDIGKKYEMSISIKSTEIEEIRNSDDIDFFIGKLWSKLEDNDAHHDERKTVMRSAIAEVWDSLEKESFISLISATKKFFSKYNELYDLYIHRFSISKLLDELDQKSLEYTGKVHELISSAQTRALTIPSALIAVGALLRTPSLSNTLIVLVGVWLVKDMTKSANEIHRGTFEYISRQVNNAFDKYRKVNEEEEVKDSARLNREEINKLIRKGMFRLDDIDGWTIWMMRISIFYAFIKLFFT